MTPKFDYILSSSLSFVMHGALAAGLYGAAVTGPHIDLSPGDNGIEVSIVSAADAGIRLSALDTGVVIPSRLSAKVPEPEPSAEISLSPSVVKERPQTTKFAALAPRSIKPRPRAIEPRDLTPIPVQAPEVAQECSGNSCGARASGGRSGGGGDTKLSVIKAPKPPYPWEARRAGFEGKVVVTVAIAADGSVRDAALARSSGRADCDRSALETIRERWRFEPARVNGRPVEWRENIIVVYNLKD